MEKSATKRQIRYQVRYHINIQCTNTPSQRTTHCCVIEDSTLDKYTTMWVKARKHFLTIRGNLHIRGNIHIDMHILGGPKNSY